MPRSVASLWRLFEHGCSEIDRDHLAYVWCECERGVSWPASRRQVCTRCRPVPAEIYHAPTPAPAALDRAGAVVGGYLAESFFDRTV